MPVVANIEIIDNPNKSQKCNLYLITPRCSMLRQEVSDSSKAVTTFVFLGDVYAKKEIM